MIEFFVVCCWLVSSAKHSISLAIPFEEISAFAGCAVSQTLVFVAEYEIESFIL